jgi:O-antigen ligase
VNDLRNRLAPSEALGGPLTLAVAGLTVLVAIVGSHFSLAIFVGASIALAVVVAYASLSWPRRVLVIVALSPILDRYIAPGLLDQRAEYLAHFLSEGLLLVVGLLLVAQAIVRGTLRTAVFHPAVAFLAGFVAVAVASAVANAVTPAQALAGIIFTLDAAAFFVLARIVGFSDRDAVRAISAFVALMTLAAVIAVGQALLSPNLFGLYALQGRFGEVYRLASFFGDPNVFGALLSAALGFTVYAIRGQSTRARQLGMGAVTAVLLMALLLSFSRGGWLGALVGLPLVGLILDRRSLAIGLAIAAAMFVVVTVMPRDLLGGGSGDRPSLIDSTVGRIGAVGEGEDLRTLFVKNAVPLVRDHPLLGVGPGRYGGAVADLFGTEVYAEYGTDKLFVNPAQRTVDNFWLHLLGETGFLGILAFGAAIVVPVIQLMRAALRSAARHRLLLTGIVAAVLAICVNSVTTMLLESNSVAFLFWLILGIGTVIAASRGTAEEPVR